MASTQSSFAVTGPASPVVDSVRVDQVTPSAKAGMTVRLILAILVAFIMLIPVIWMAMTAFKSRPDATAQRCHAHEGFLAGLVVHHHAVAVAGAQQEQIHVLVVEGAVASRLLDLLLGIRMLLVEHGEDFIAILADLGALLFDGITFGAEQAGGRRQDQRAVGRDSQQGRRALRPDQLDRSGLRRPAGAAPAGRGHGQASQAG